MRKVEKLSSGRYKVRFRWQGKQTSESFDLHADAKRFAELLDLLGPVKAVDWLYSDAPSRDQVPSVDMLAEAHIDSLTHAQPDTRDRYRRLWHRTWSKGIGHYPADTITTDLLAKAVGSLAQHYSAKSLQNQRGLLAAVLDRAVREGHLDANPVKGLRLPRSREVERQEMTVITRDGYQDIRNRLAPHYRPLVDFLVGTGARWGEAVTLQVQDWDRPNIWIRRALKNDGSVGPPKTRNSRRKIALGKVLAETIDDLCEGRERTDLIFTAPRGGQLGHRSFWSRGWHPAVAHLKPRPRIHDLRHTHASWLLAAGVPIHVVRARLGHESITTTVDTYSHLLPDAQLAAAEAAEIAISGITESLPAVE